MALGRLLPAVFACTVVLFGVRTAVGCTKDTDCKGDRICIDGACVDPGTYPSENMDDPDDNRDDSVPEAALPPDQQKLERMAPGRTGWTLPAGILGLSSAAATLGLGLASLATLDNLTDTDSILGGSAILVLMAMAPVTAVGAHSGEARGSTGLEIAGWVTYGLGISSGLLALAVVDVDDDEAGPFVGVTIGFATVSLLSMAGSAFIAHGRSKSASTATRTVAPSAGLIVDSQGQAQPTIGLSLSF